MREDIQADVFKRKKTEKMTQWLKDIVNFVFPAECHVCGNSLAPHERFLCGHCLGSLPRTGYHRNLRNPMEQRFAGHFPFVAATGHFFYSRESSLAQLFQDMKYRGFSKIGEMLGEVTGKELYIAGFLSDVDVVVPVPMYFLKQAKRGYNQVDHIAKGISMASGIDILNALKMTRQRKSQTILNQEQRMKNAEHLFKVREGVDLDNKGVLLVDDVCTTGTTLGAAASALTSAFPSCRLYLLTLGVTY